MYTCDFCGRDCLSPENLTAVIEVGSSAPHFYDYCDLLICGECPESIAGIENGTLEIVPDEEIEAYETLERVTRND